MAKRSTRRKSVSDKVRENRLRRMAERRGFTLVKSRRRDPGALDFGRYMLIDAETNAVIFGASTRANAPCAATLDDIAEFFNPPLRAGRIRVTKRRKV